MTSRQFSEWMAYARLRGLPQERADFRSGQICAVLGNIHRSADSRPYVPSDFMPRDLFNDEPEAPQAPDPQDLSRQIMHLFGKKE